MFRTTSSFNNIRTLLRCHRTLDYHLASIICSRNYAAIVGKPPRRRSDDYRIRETCPVPPPPPPPPPKDDSLFWGTMCALFIAGIGIVTAKNSPEIRDWLSIYAPLIDDIVAILYQENMSYSEFATECVDGVKKFINDQRKPKQICNSVEPPENSVDGKNCGCIEPPPPPKVEETKDMLELGGECKPVELPVITHDICSIEQCIKELCEFVTNNYLTARDACSYYNELVDELMDTEFSIHAFKALCAAKCEREGLVKESLNNISNSLRRLEEMNRYLDCGVTASKEEIDKTKLLYRNLKAGHKARRMEFQWENDTALSKDALWLSIKDVVMKHTSDLEALYPTYKFENKKSVFQGDADVLLYSTYRMVRKLNDDLGEASAILSERVNRAYDSLCQDPNKLKEREGKLKALIAQKQADLVKSFKDKVDKQKIKNDKRLQEMSKRQKERHDSTLQTRLAEKEAEIKKEFDAMVRKHVEQEKRLFAAQLFDMSLKLKTVEEKLEERLKAERETRRSQELWAAGASLLAATKKGTKCVNVCKELKAIEKASTDDKLVQTVMKSIPASVREKGIVPECVLRETYAVMEDTALKIALVEEEGALLPVYALSWLQALLLFMKIPGIPQKEFDNPPKVPCKDLDTFDLLQRARFWVNRGNMAQALAYVDNLKGASRLAAHCWYETARAHVEVRQAAEAILAHAASMGLQYI